MKKTYFLSALLCCLFALAACGKGDKDTDGEPHYYDIQTVDNGQLGALEDGQFLLGRQYYQGKPVNLIAEPAQSEEATDAIDVYLLSMDGDKTLLMSGVSRKYRISGWYLDEKGRCFVKGISDITGLDKDGSPRYQSALSGLVIDICSTKKGRVFLLTQKTGGGRALVELNPDTGDTTLLENITLDPGNVYISSLDNDLLILDSKGIWQADLKEGSKDLLLSFTGTLFSLENVEKIADFGSDGKGADILLSTGKSEHLEWVDVNDEKEVIILRAAYTEILKESLNLFNQSNDTYYVVLEESGLDSMAFWTGGGLSAFQSETNSKLAAGKGADIICSDALYEDISSFIEKGVFVDLAPFMKASGIREEDYSKAAFDAWRDGDKIYGITPYIMFGGMVVDKALLRSSGEPATIEAFVDSLLAFEEDRCLCKGWDGVDILYYFLGDSESLCGMVDWEKGTCDFNGELFAKMLQAAKRYGADEVQQYSEIMDGRDYNDDIYIFETEEKLAADNLAPLNYFFDDGVYPRSSISDGNEVVMGINAASEHMEGAWQLLAFLLGEEAQTSMAGPLYLRHYSPVNLDVFDKMAQTELDYEETFVDRGTGEKTFLPGRNRGSQYGRLVLEEQTVTEIRQMLAEVRTSPYKSAPLVNIITEETAYYFNDAKSMEEVIVLVQNRVKLYLDEHRADS